MFPSEIIKVRIERVRGNYKEKEKNKGKGNSPTGNHFPVKDEEEIERGFGCWSTEIASILLSEFCGKRNCILMTRFCFTSSSGRVFTL